MDLPLHSTAGTIAERRATDARAERLRNVGCFILAFALQIRIFISAYNETVGTLSYVINYSGYAYGSFSFVPVSETDHTLLPMLCLHPPTTALP